MATFLTTAKMSPELRERIQSSVSGRRPHARSRVSPRAIMWVRAVVLLTVVGAAFSLGFSKRQADQELEADRGRLLMRWNRQASALGPAERAVVVRAEPWLTRAAQDYEGDWIAPEIRAPGAFAQALSRPMVYVRGSLETLKAPKGIERSSLDSAPDPLVLCLMAPPQARLESSLLRKVRWANAGGEQMHKAAAHVERLGAALVGLPLLEPSYKKRISVAENQRELFGLRRTFELAPIESAKRAARAEVLLFAVDEAGDRSVPAELDGERPHYVRVGLVDLKAKQALLRVRKAVDPSRLSDANRAEHARGIDSCALALDIHEAVAAAASP